ncbi:tRNA (adenosine(37)-N6)-dimethylallyltransferase MiaA [Vineibacter terrae]|uniref:tRNA dimethylallyltransferase n=1 Tax=Vineibacter terrae TaxID=2586908 RepID=A0A5C8PQS0_9HYPH|nr:tRNA (adenosine(37)-N6)-dimethylallyltransferase MiaA [Vineibacter terrae]TXL77533.1 tRNA (adenosine(37)-N6)-dimethylallyltransferase MiaA [Vineibacter terrae]
MNPVLVIIGPTASGKSALGLDLATRPSLRIAGRAFSGGTVINMDSMQVYRELPIITAQPSAAEQSRAPHRLYGVLPAWEVGTAARWRAMARIEIETALAAARLPILVGGTGLYLRALTDGLSPIPEIPAGMRAASRALWAELGPQAFHARLMARDPATAQRLAVNDRQRLVRAWEVLEATGRSITAWQQAAGAEMPPPWRFITVLLAPDRAWLRARHRRRFEAMVQGGVLDEVRALEAVLAARGRLDGLTLDGIALPALKAHGVPELRACLHDGMSLADAVTRAVLNTSQYAKRQMTWARHQIISDIVVETTENNQRRDMEKFLDKIAT